VAACNVEWLSQIATRSPTEADLQFNQSIFKQGKSQCSRVSYSCIMILKYKLQKIRLQIPRLITSEPRNTGRCVGIHSFPTSNGIRAHRWMLTLQHIFCVLWRPSGALMKGETILVCCFLEDRRLERPVKLSRN
jgi:hypothetical protein